MFDIIILTINDPNIAPPAYDDAKINELYILFDSVSSAITENIT